MFSYNRECASERVAPETERVCSLYFRIRSLVFTRDAVCGYTLSHTQADLRDDVGNGECVLFTLECVLVFSLLEDAVYGHMQADLREDV